MRQASWIAFLLLAIGLVTYEASLDQQGVNAGDQTVAVGGAPEMEAADGGVGEPPPKP
jgi:hypothetical protein